MKKHLTILAVVLVAVCIAMPALAAVEFKYGGQFRTRLTSGNNVYDGMESDAFSSNYNGDDNRLFIDQRLRLYFSFIASQNLKVVTKFEMGDAVWGKGGASNNTGPGTYANVGADGVSVEVKNAYVEFNIPNCASTAIIGVQSAVLLDSWIIDDDFPAAVLVTKLEPLCGFPLKVTLGYVAGQNGWESKFDSFELPMTNQQFNVDDFFVSFDYASGPFKASLIGFFQNAHNSDVSINPTTLNTPVRSFTGGPANLTGVAFPFFTGFYPSLGIDGLLYGVQPQDNYLFDLGFNFTYKCDWLLAYVNFVRNFGGADLVGPSLVGSLPVFPGEPLKVDSVDYEGFMIDVGVTYFCGPYTFNVGGFYTSGPEINSNPDLNGGTFNGVASSNVDWFTYPLATSKYFSEIIGGGVLGDDLYTIRGYNGSIFGSGIGSNGSLQTVYWRGYGFPTNLWTVTVGGSWQCAEKTKISASYWYFGTAEDVPYAWNPVTEHYKMSSNIGHELDFYLDQGIVDGLTLTLVGAYLIAEDAFCPLPTTGYQDITSSLADDAWELGARLQWNF